MSDGTDILLHRIDDVKEAIPENILIKKKVNYVEKFRPEKHNAVKQAHMYHVPQVVKKLPINTRLYNHKEQEPVPSPVAIPKWRKWNKHDGIVRKKLAMELEPRHQEVQQTPPQNSQPVQPSPAPDNKRELVANARLVAYFYRKNLMSKFVSLWIQRWYRAAVARAKAEKQ